MGIVSSHLTPSHFNWSILGPLGRRLRKPQGSFVKLPALLSWPCFAAESPKLFSKNSTREAKGMWLAICSCRMSKPTVKLKIESTHWWNPVPCEGHCALPYLAGLQVLSHHCTENYNRRSHCHQYVSIYVPRYLFFFLPSFLPFLLSCMQLHRLDISKISEWRCLGRPWFIRFL